MHQLGRYPRRGTAKVYLSYPRHCERSEAIHSFFVATWIASRSPSSGAHSRDPLARNDGLKRLARWLFEN